MPLALYYFIDEKLQLQSSTTRATLVADFPHTGGEAASTPRRHGAGRRNRDERSDAERRRAAAARDRRCARGGRHAAGHLLPVQPAPIARHYAERLAP